MLLSSNSQSFIRSAVASGQRTDGRLAMDVRAMRIEFPARRGVAEVRIGRTRVVSRVTAELVEPFEDRPAEGLLSLFVTCSPMASPEFEAGRPKEEAQELSAFVERCIRDSGALDVETLCVVASKKVWCVRVEVVLTDHCGNSVDCAVISALAALRSFRLPELTIIGEEVTIHQAGTRAGMALNMPNAPICISFALINEQMICDPSIEEEAVADALLTVALNQHGHLSLLHLPGGFPLPKEQISYCIQIATVKAKEVLDVLQVVLKREGENKAQAIADSLMDSKQITVEETSQLKMLDVEMEVDAGAESSEMSSDEHEMTEAVQNSTQKQSSVENAMVDLGDDDDEQVVVLETEFSEQDSKNKNELSEKASSNPSPDQSAEARQIEEGRRQRRQQYKESTELTDAVRPENERKALLKKRQERRRKLRNTKTD